MLGYLIVALALIATPAHANPLTLFFIKVGVGNLLAASLTQLVIGYGLQLALNVFAPKSSRASRIKDAQVNLRLETAVRNQLGGVVAVGGSVGTFAEKDSSGNLWYFVAHGDAEVTGTPSYILDGIAVALSDGSGGFTAGDVLTADFCLDNKGAQYAGTGTKVPVFRLYTVTPTSGSPFGTRPAAFVAAFPTLPFDFYLAGVCYTIVRCAALDANRYQNAMKWQGALGLGEPSVVIVGNFNRMYDPRNGAHNINTPSTWTASNGNTAIVWAWWRTSRYGRNRAMTEVNWTKVSEQANICDLTVLNRASVATPLYRSGFAFGDDLGRQECEKEILDSADAYVCYDEAGLAYPVVGYYAAPTLTFTAARDITSAQTEIIDDGDAALDGVVVYYIEPSLGYTRQPCAPWFNYTWYNGTSAPNLAHFDILTCKDHNQAVRLAKAIGQRIAPVRKAAMTTTIKGILAKGLRAITLDYDATFAGVYEIAGPVEEGSDGASSAFAVVPLGVDRWYLNGGEEGIPPSATPVLGTVVPNTFYPDPPALLSPSAAGSVGAYTAQFATENDANQYAVGLYRGATNVFTAATRVHTVFAGPNFEGYDTETGVAAGTWYIWLEPLNPAFKAGPVSGPFTVTVT